MRRVTWPLALLVLGALACSLGAPRRATPTPLVEPPSATVPATALPSATAAAPTEPPSATPPATATVRASATAADTATLTPAPSATSTAAPTEAAASATPEGGGGNPTFLAYVQKGQLLVTNVTGGTVGGTTQYTQAGVNDRVFELVWSPDGQSVAFVSSGAGGDSHLYVVYAVGAGTPVDLGPGSEPSWSPDSARLVYVREGNIWITAVEDPKPHALTAQTQWNWGRPVFTPAGDSLVVSGQPFNNMGASGNTQFELDSLPLDGSGKLTPLPGFSQKVDGRLPIDLSFSPDGQHLAFSTSWHLSACASSGQYYVANADGSGLTQLVSQKLNALLDPGKDFYYIVRGYAWKPKSDGLLTTSLVIDCTNFAGTRLGEAMSTIDLTNHETVLATGFFESPSYDHSGSLIAVAQPGDNGAAGQVMLYDANGHPVGPVGEGDLPAFQP